MPRLRDLLATSPADGEEAFLRAILAASPDCVKVLSGDGTLEFMNERGVELNQLPSSDAVIGSNYVDLWPEREWGKVRVAIARAVAGETCRMEGFSPTAKGEPRWWEVGFAPFRSDGAPVRVVAISRDITDRVLAEQTRQGATDALAELNATLAQQVRDRTAERNMFATIVESTDIMVMACAFDYTILAMNNASRAEFQRIYGATPQVGDNMLDLLSGQPGHQAQVRAAWARGLTGQHVTFMEQYGDPHRARPCYEVNFRPLYDDEGALIGCYQFVIDVTQRLRDQAKLSEAQDALRQSQKMEAVGQLTGGLAHDFNNLLTGISGSLDLLQKRVTQGRLGELDRYLVAAQGASKRAAALTHRLLAFSRRQTLDPKPTDVQKLVLGMTDLIRRTVGPQIAVETVDTPGLWATLVDPPQLENALLNLCINARDAMPDGGRITIETANRWMDERTARECDMEPGPYLSLHVGDTGAGMPPEVVARAFDPFFTTKPLGQGTGLGLSMIYGFVRQSGGQVRILSEVGRGTTVCIDLPRHLGPAEGQAVEQARNAMERAGTGETVLVVDDEPSVRMLIGDVLQDLGYAAREAEDGATGLQILRSGAPIDLLVTDVGLPGGMNGRQVADAARALRPGLKVLFITGYAENAAVGNGHLEPGMAVMTKPFAMDDLAAKIRGLIAG